MFTHLTHNVVIILLYFVMIRLQVLQIKHNMYIIICQSFKHQYICLPAKTYLLHRRQDQQSHQEPCVSCSQRSHAALSQCVANKRGPTSQAIQFQPLLAGEICPRRPHRSRLRAGCLNEGWTTIDAITPHLGRVIIVVKEAGYVSAEWAS